MGIQGEQLFTEVLLPTAHGGNHLNDHIKGDWLNKLSIATKGARQLHSRMREIYINLCAVTSGYNEFKVQKV